jgi:hypothetical protein
LLAQDLVPCLRDRPLKCTFASHIAPSVCSIEVRIRERQSPQSSKFDQSIR